jgi:type IV secretory pathway VirB10-like protein
VTDLSKEARAIIDEGRSLDNPGGAARERARKAVLARIAAAAAVTAFPAGAAAVTAPIVKIVLPAVLMVASGVGGGLWWRAAHNPDAKGARPAAAATLSTRTPAPAMAPRPPPEPRQEAAAKAAAATEPTAEPAEATAPASRPRHAKAKPAEARRTAVAPPPADSLQDETALLARVNAALRAGDARGGLALLDEYDRQFPRGVLHEERAATRIIARCQAGDASAAQAARRFVQTNPRSPLSSRVRSSCLIEPGR